MYCITLLIKSYWSFVPAGRIPLIILTKFSWALTNNSALIMDSMSNIDSEKVYQYMFNVVKKILTCDTL